ncbi:hypothetical protein EQH94_16855 (plasmid) [Lactiplantibacillus plantarum]|uniref:hypothetical protein n=1 Tax=Lactiplantibacillus plantarum TaxID=1590 RepID=UPI000FF8E61B|nr:hypothetical protein [Lactiplantibacillus plantarum]QAR77677.1 hypothetical protein EQH94_16855 [Lactiplantibacillus plantarum]
MVLGKGPSGQPGRYPLADHWLAKLGDTDPGTSDGLDTASDDTIGSSCDATSENDGDILKTAKVG